MGSSHCWDSCYSCLKICSGEYFLLTSSFPFTFETDLSQMKGYYQPTARELVRINGTTKAPIMNYAAETALGAATIRGFKMEHRFFNNYLKLVDTDAKTFFCSNAALEWLVFRTEILQNLTLFTAAFLLVLLPKGYLSPGNVLLSIKLAAEK